MMVHTTWPWPSTRRPFAIPFYLHSDRRIRNGSDKVAPVWADADGGTGVPDEVVGGLLRRGATEPSRSLKNHSKNRGSLGPSYRRHQRLSYHLVESNLLSLDEVGSWWRSTFRWRHTFRCTRVAATEVWLQNLAERFLLMLVEASAWWAVPIGLHSRSAGSFSRQLMTKEVVHPS